MFDHILFYRESPSGFEWLSTPLLDLVLTIMNLQEIYHLIGPTGVVLIAVAAVALYIALWNVIYLNVVWFKFKTGFFNIKNGGVQMLKKNFSKNTNPLISIVRDIVLTHAGHSDDIRAEVAYLFHRNFKSVINSLTWLKLIAAISPLLGLLGTVLGMVHVFRTIADNVSPDPTALASGIWTALITTVMGLTVAIPALMAYYFLFLKIKEFRVEAIEYSYQALEINKETTAKRLYAGNPTRPI